MPREGFAAPNPCSWRCCRESIVTFSFVGMNLSIVDLMYAIGAYIAFVSARGAGFATPSVMDGASTMAGPFLFPGKTR